MHALAALAYSCYSITGVQTIARRFAFGFASHASIANVATHMHL